MRRPLRLTTGRGARIAGISLVLVLGGLAVLLTSLQARRVVPPLAGTYGSVDRLAEEILAAVERGDVQALRGAALTAEEFRDHVWPGLPVAQPGRNVPFDFVWRRLSQHSDGYLRQTMASYQGRSLTLVGVEFAGDTTEYGSARVHRETWLRVRDTAGAESRVRLFGSTIEQDGRYKVFSYVVDD